MATFYIEAIENTNIALVMVGSPTIGTVKYGVNDSTCPNTYTVTTESTPISLTAGQKCYWTITSTTTAFTTSKYLKFTSTAKINVGGNLSDLIGGSTKIPRNYCFNGLFYNCTNLISASNLVLVNDFNLNYNCYQYMFRDCTSLTTAPELPATTLTLGCYRNMFEDCTSLTTPPALPATTLAGSCYQSMFQGCTSLTTAPELPATTLADSCYKNMFQNCASLTTAPTLPATTLVSYCYGSMFIGCTSLTTPPELPATTLASYCYQSMFRNCTNINLSETQIAPYSIPYRIPSEGTGTVGTSSLDDMFTNTGGTFKGTPTINTTYYFAPYATFYIEAVEDTDIALSKVGTPTVGDAYYGVKDHNVPNAYTYGDTIYLTAGQKCYWFVTSTSDDFSTSNYLKFTSTAKINVGGNMSDLIGGDTKIPRNYCFYGLFWSCIKLVSASNLVLVNDFNNKSSCYHAMLQGCTSLTTTPALPATTLANSCYNSMFASCTSLTTAPELPATTLAGNCYYNMFFGCTSLTTPPALPATTLADSCYNRMFFACRNIKLSETQTTPYSIPYRIPSEETGTVGTSSLTDMFSNTGGTFTGTPTINTTYYLVPYATFYIEAVEDTDITLSKVGTPTVGDACYGVNNHGVSNVYNYGDTIHLTAGQKCYWFITSTTTAFSFSNYLNFTSTAKINVGGNLSDLIGGETKLPRNYCFRGLFQNCTSLIDASNLAVVNNFNFKTYCYQYMFYNCTSLTTLPELLATTLTNNCYSSMFRGCASLSIAPTLPATTLADSCYGNMFQDCTSLTTPPELPITTLANGCYGNMFQGCTSLTTTPELPATTLADWCYSSMFRDCKSLTTAPALPATTLTSYCYQYMFYGCANIKLSETQTAPYSIPYRIPSEGTGTEGTSSLSYMFTSTGGTFTGTPTINTTYYLAPYATFYIEAIENTDITLSKVGTPTVGDAYYGVNNHNVPNAYTYGNIIHLTAGQKCYWFITSTSTAFSSSNYLNFTSTAKINVGGNLSDLIGGDTKIPREYCFYRLFFTCIKLVDASNLVLVNDFNSKGSCYNGMFFFCSSLTTPPTLPATTLTSGCYSSMFNNCTSLTTAPELPATTLTNQCYSSMFSFCTSLATPPELPATILDWGCYRFMFNGCTSLTTLPELPATTLADNCYEEMFNGCTNIKLSETQTVPYLIPYRIPSEGVGTATSSALSNMFTNTGGTFVGTPTINTTYYLAPYTTFYIEAVEDTDITLSKVGTPIVGDACYGINDQGVPNAYTYGDTIHLTAGQKCYWFVTSTSANFDFSNYLKFTSTAKINVGGNMSDLIGEDTKIPRDYCFYNLFYNCKKLVSASNLVLVNNFNNKSSCYRAMLQGCTSLTTTPALLATTLAESCYSSMFSGCISLTTAPELPATTLASYCYYNMFNGCRFLIAPELPATTLADHCYGSMFYGCTSLTTPPELPVTTLAESCYGSMFRNCTSLITLPQLPATTLTNYCYDYMFSGCTNIKLSETQTVPYSIPYRIPSEGTGTEGTGSLGNMFTSTGGTFTGTPTINTIYYLAPPSSPISITYKGQELANFETGSKTIKCGGKYMEDDVIIAREIGTNNVVVLYNSGTILTFQNGTKTLKCAGKGMATDLVIQTS